MVGGAISVADHMSLDFRLSGISRLASIVTVPPFTTTVSPPSRSRQLLRKRCQPNGRHVMPQRKLLAATVDYETPVRPDIVAGHMKSLVHARREAAFDLDGPHFAAGQFESQIDLDPCRGTVETGDVPSGAAPIRVSMAKPSQLAPTTGWPVSVSVVPMPSNACTMPLSRT